MTTGLSDIPLIFKEENVIQKKGLVPLPSVPSYTEEPSEAVDFICFPYLIRDAVMAMKVKNMRIKKIREENKDLKPKEVADIVFEDIPRLITARYRKYLKKQFPSISEKPLILILTTDRDPPYSVPDDVFCVRTSLRKSNQRAQDRAFPSPIDWKEYNGPLKSSSPSIGFCGVPHNNIYRSSLLMFLQRSELSKTDFIFRKRFLDFLDVTAEEKERLRKEFRTIIHRNIFSVSCRGAGNYSHRFYETLRAGRIPVLLDSDMPLPFDNEIDWDEFIIFKKTPEEVEETILDWIANRDLVAIQNQCRKIWEEYLYFPKALERLPSQFKTN